MSSVSLNLKQNKINIFCTFRKRAEIIVGLRRRKIFCRPITVGLMKYCFLYVTFCMMYFVPCVRFYNNNNNNNNNNILIR